MSRLTTAALWMTVLNLLVSLVLLAVLVLK